MQNTNSPGRWSLQRSQNSGEVRIRRPARRAHGREPGRRRFSIGSSAPAATGSAPSSNGLVTDPEGRRGRVRSGITFPKYPPDDLSPEQLMTPEPSVTEGFRAFEASAGTAPQGPSGSTRRGRSRIGTPTAARTGGPLSKWTCARLRGRCCTYVGTLSSRHSSPRGRTHGARLTGQDSRGRTHGATRTGQDSRGRTHGARLTGQGSRGRTHGAGLTRQNALGKVLTGQDSRGRTHGGIMAGLPDSRSAPRGSGEAGEPRAGGGVGRVRREASPPFALPLPLRALPSSPTWER